jgi:DNA-binding NarL/FixJ family response regulator
VRLSKRMQEFLKLLCHPEGYHYKQIAAIMKCSIHTLRTYQRRIAERYGVNGKSALIAWAFANGFAGKVKKVAVGGKTRRTR